VPGSRHAYSNFGYAALGAICEMVSGKPLDALARELLFSPLGIDAAYLPGLLEDTENVAAVYDHNHALTHSIRSQLDVRSSDELGRDHHLAQGNLTISALDYARVLAMLANGGVLGGVRVLSEDAVDEMHTASVDAGQYLQGLGVRYMDDGSGLFWHTGSGRGTYAQFFYVLDGVRGVVVLTTGAATERAASGKIDVCTDLAALLWRELGF